jgi:hypothetical protein
LSSKGKPNVVKVKVKAYPIAARLTIGAAPAPIPGQILKLTPHGFLVEALVPAMKTGEKFTIAFELPVLHKMITDHCVVVKMYTSPETQVVEGHFQSITGDNESAIMRFLASIPKAAES